MDNDHPHIGQPQPFCMCIDCREWRRRILGSSDAATNTHLFNIARNGQMNGKGFIVVDPRNISFEEHDDIDEANDVAAFIASQAGRAIIYMPVAVVRPNIDSKARITSAHILEQAARLLNGGVAGQQVARLTGPTVDVPFQIESTSSASADVDTSTKEPKQ